MRCISSSVIRNGKKKEKAHVNCQNRATKNRKQMCGCQRQHRATKKRKLFGNCSEENKATEELSEQYVQVTEYRTKVEKRHMQCVKQTIEGRNERNHMFSCHR